MSLELTCQWRPPRSCSFCGSFCCIRAIVDPLEILDKHFLDSVAILPEVKFAKKLLDIGSGAGLPGLPLKIMLPELSVVMVESVAKKVGFVKQAIASLNLKDAACIQKRAEGAPAEEGLPLADCVVSRAFCELSTWVPLAARYLLQGGRVVAMLAQPPPGSVVRSVEAHAGMRKVSERSYHLPLSGDPRCVLTFERST